jgi:lipopolysaccharide transport system permease protein
LTNPAASAAPISEHPHHITVIEPRDRWWLVAWGELWSYRELLYYLVWRDIKVRYKQTALGFVWALVQPLSAVIVFSVFFGRLAHIETGGLPYPLFAYTGTLLWQFFARSLSEASTSLAANERLLTKIYFPRLYLPASVVLAAVVDLMVALVLAIPFILYFGYAPRATVLLVPLVVFMVMMAAFGIGMAFSSLDVRYRDVRYVLPFIVQTWMFASPVVYPSSLVPEKWRPLFALNPMAGFIETFRGALVGDRHVPWNMLFVSCGAALTLCAIGLYVFQATERRIADIV